LVLSAQSCLPHREVQAAMPRVEGDIRCERKIEDFSSGQFKG